MSRKKSDEPQAGVVIRNKVFRFSISAARAGKPVKLPSTRIYAEELGLSQRTVIAEMQNLVKKGLITSKNGIGYFTTMHGQIDNESLRYLTGLCYGSNSVHNTFDFNQWSLLTQAGSAITIHKTARVLPVYISGYGPDSFYGELESIGLDAAVFVFCPEFWLKPLRRFLKEGHPVVTLLQPMVPFEDGNFLKTGKIPYAAGEGLPNVDVDRYNCGRKIARLAMKHLKNADRPVYWCNYYDVWNSIAGGGFRNEFRGKNPIRFFDSSTELIGQLQKDFRSGKLPAMIFTHSTWTADLLQLFTAAGLDPYAETLFAGDICHTKFIPGYQGLSFGYPHAEIGEAVNTLLVQQKEHKKVKNILLPMIIREDFS